MVPLLECQSYHILRNGDSNGGYDLSVLEKEKS